VVAARPVDAGPWGRLAQTSVRPASGLGAAPRREAGGAMYGYVVVGAGSAGCVLAARLGEDRDVRVGVIEAGPPDTEPVLHMPLAFRQLWDSRFDWGLWSEPEPGLASRRGYLPRGRVLGGKSRTAWHRCFNGRRSKSSTMLPPGSPANLGLPASSAAHVAMTVVVAYSPFRLLLPSIAL
jgi:hypothetical protein